MKAKSSRFSRWREDDGRVTAFVAVLMAGILALAGLTLDGGLALAAKVKADGQAEAAARAGAQAIDLVAYRNSGTLKLLPNQAMADAQNNLASVGSSGTATASDEMVTVTVTAVEYTQLLGLIGISTITVHGKGSARPQRGVLTTEP